MTLTLERDKTKKSMQQVELGLERLLEDQIVDLKGARVGLICNQASVDHGFRHAADLVHSHPDINLRALFGPQHGIRGDVQDNMIETEHGVDRKTGLPVHSLYSETREPTEAMLDDVDVLVFAGTLRIPGVPTAWHDWQAPCLMVFSHCCWLCTGPSGNSPAAGTLSIENQYIDG